VRKLIADKTPDQLKMKYALWTRAAVGQLIEQRFGIRLPVRTMGLYLERWGFTPQKPMRKAYVGDLHRDQQGHDALVQCFVLFGTSAAVGANHLLQVRGDQRGSAVALVVVCVAASGVVASELTASAPLRSFVGLGGRRCQ
jgi:hypothetical protein